MKKGDLVSVGIGEPGEDYYELNRDLVEEDGYLWFLIGKRKAESPSDAHRVMWDCRSLATGHVAAWFEDEMKVAANV